MGLECYNFLLFPIKNKVILGDDGWEFIGDSFAKFKSVYDLISSFNEVQLFEPNDSWPGYNKQCYFCYNDSFKIIEFEINGGIADKKVAELSVRFALCNPDGTYEKALSFCRLLSEELEFNILDMKLGEIIDFKNEIQLLKSRKVFEEKRKQFYETLNLPQGIITAPVHCGSAVMDLLRRGKS